MVLADEFATYAGAAAAILVAGAGALLRLIQTAANKRIVELKSEINDRIDAQTNGTVVQFGETMSAIRQKMTDMELWNRDNFVNQRAFDAIVTDIRESWRRFEDKIDRRFDAVDRKLTKMDNGNEN